MSKRPPPDPVSVLRGHRASVMDVCFHPSKNMLFSGAADGELRIWDTVQHQTISSAWLHSAAHGIIGVAASHSIGENKPGQGWNREFWDIGNGSLSRNPLLTIKTNSYHFCKLSLVKKSFIESWQPEAPKNDKDTKSGDTGDQEIQTETSRKLEGNENVQGPKYVAVSGEQSSVVELWDLATGQKFMQLLDGSSGSPNQLAKGRGLVLT